MAATEDIPDRLARVLIEQQELVREDRRLAAHHEAAHAVVAHVLGADVYYMDADVWTIDDEDRWDDGDEEQHGEDRSGYVRFHMPADDLFERVVISVVGAMAEERAGGLKVADTPDDNWTEVEGLPEVWERWERLTGQAPDRARIIHDARAKAAGMLETYWADVEGVASALLQGESWKDRLQAVVP